MFTKSKEIKIGILDRPADSLGFLGSGLEAPKPRSLPTLNFLLGGGPRGVALPASLVGGGTEVGGRGRGGAAAVGAFKAAMSGLSSGGGLCNGC